MKCRICTNPARYRSLYCARCHRIIHTNREYQAARARGLVAAYDPPYNGFRCAVSGVLLSDSDRSDPWCLNITERVPDEHDDQIVVGAVISTLKSRLTLDELLKVVPALDDTLNGGRPFPRDIIPFSRWRHGQAPAAPFVPDVGARAREAVRKCRICIREALPGSPYCARCRPFIVNHVDGPARAKVIIKYYTPAQDGFLDGYLGVLMTDSDYLDPHFMVMDHIEPGKTRMVPTSRWLNAMKGCMDLKVFKRVIAELARHIRTGEPFDRNVITRAEWKRNLAYMRLAGRKIA